MTAISKIAESTNNMNARKACIVVPVHNEAENIEEFVRAVQEATQAIRGWDLSILFVEDGSTDSTFTVIENCRSHASIPIGCLQFSKNFGHQAALEAGLLHADGDAVISMDGDLQHPPSEIPRILEALERGVDVVQMVRDRPAGGHKGLLSRWFYAIFTRWSPVGIIPDASDYRLITRRVIDVLAKIPERDKFLRGLLPTLGFKQECLLYREGNRNAGVPSYTFIRSLKLAQKALFDFSLLPLRLVFALGLTLAFASFIGGVWHILNKLIRADQVVPGFTDIIVAILFLSGCMLISIGVLGRYMMLILDQVRGRPPYVINTLLPPTSHAQSARTDHP